MPTAQYERSAFLSVCLDGFSFGLKFFLRDSYVVRQYAEDAAQGIFIEFKHADSPFRRGA